MFVSPQEPKEFYVMGAVSSLPEEYGCDFLWDSELGLVGVQRKKFPNDFLPSIHDGRLQREYGMMQSLDVAVLLLEGQGNWTLDGELIAGRDEAGYRWTRQQHRNYLTSVMMKGIQVHTTDSKSDTMVFLSDLKSWSNKKDHTGLDRRPKPKGDRWGKLTNADYLSHLYQSFKGVGPKQAVALIQRWGVILKPTITEEELTQTPGWGKVRARQFMEVFEYAQDSDRGGDS